MTLANALPFGLLAVLGLALGGLYAGLETGIYTLNPVRLMVSATRGKPRAIRLREATRHAERTIAVILIGTNAAHYVASYAVAELLHGTGMGHWTLIVVEALLLTPLLFVFAEILPKDLFRTHGDQWMYRLVPVISASRLLFTVIPLLPCVQLLVAIGTRSVGGRGRGAPSARQRISHLIREGVGAGVLSLAQASITDRALELHERRVRDVMVRWRHVTMLTLSEGAAEDRRRRETLFRERTFTRVPVVDGTGRIRGVLSWIEVALQPEATTSELITPALELAVDTPLLHALTTMRAGRQTMAVVTDPGSGRPLGLVTLKDLVEPLTGQLQAW